MTIAQRMKDMPDRPVVFRQGWKLTLESVPRLGGGGRICQKQDHGS